MLDPKEVIIDKPQALDGAIKLRDSVITVTFWAVFIYLFRPLLSLLLWMLFGIHIFNPKVFNVALLAQAENFVAQNILAITAFAIIFVSWALYNQITYGRLRRRKKISDIKDEDIARSFGIDVETLQEWRRSRRLLLDVVQEGQSIRVSQAV